LTSEDLKKPVKMKTVFISASPVLVNEVSRFYARLKEALINDLVTKERQADSTSDSSSNSSVTQKHQEMM
jgi:hypothetical protein